MNKTSSWWHWYGFSPVCVPIWTLHYYFVQSISHVGCIRGASPQCVLLHDALDRYFGQNINHIDCILVVYLQCVMNDVWSCSPGYCCSTNHLKAEHELVSHLCVFSGDILDRVYEQNIKLMALIWLLSCVCSHMNFTLLFCTKHFPCWLHLLGFSSVCVIAWRIGSLSCNKTLIILTAFW